MSFTTIIIHPSPASEHHIFTYIHLILIHYLYVHLIYTKYTAVYLASTKFTNLTIQRYIYSKASKLSISV